MANKEKMWEKVTLTDVMDFREGPGIMAREFRNFGVPLIRLAGLKRGASLLEGCNFLDAATVESRWQHFRVEPGDVLLSTSASLGEVAVVDQSAAGAIPYTGIIRFRANSSRILQSFIEFALTAPSFKLQVEAMGVGSVMRHFGPTHLRQMTIDLPSRDQQTAIASLLGALDDKIAVNEHASRDAHTLMKLKYADAIRVGATTTTIGEIADIIDGPHATPAKTKSGPWFLSISSLRNGRLELAESAHLTEEDFRKWTRRVTPRGGDVLFSYETRLGEAALMPSGIRACLGRRMALIRTRSGTVGSRTLLQAYLSRSFQDTISQHIVRGATVDRISLTDLPTWSIDLPSQKALYLEDALTSLDDLASSKERESETLSSLRDMLLPKLMSGEIRIRDAEKLVGDAT